jgi:hypothetical protein
MAGVAAVRPPQRGCSPRSLRIPSLCRSHPRACESRLNHAEQAREVLRSCFDEECSQPTNSITYGVSFSDGDELEER